MKNLVSATCHVLPRQSVYIDPMSSRQPSSTPASPPPAYSVQPAKTSLEAQGRNVQSTVTDIINECLKFRSGIQCRFREKGILPRPVNVTLLFLLD